MARKFLYAIVVLVVLAAAVLFALRLAPGALTRAALVPTGEFERQARLEGNAYADPEMWFSMPGKGASDPTRWLPPGAEPEGAVPVAVFFVHPTSYLERARCPRGATPAGCC